MNTEINKNIPIWTQHLNIKSCWKCMFWNSKTNFDGKFMDLLFYNSFPESFFKVLLNSPSSKNSEEVCVFNDVEMNTNINENIPIWTLHWNIKSCSKHETCWECMFWTNFSWKIHRSAYFLTIFQKVTSWF